MLCPKTGRRIKNNRRNWCLICLFPIIGLISLIWFLIRVVPKPSRALYPCQRVAFPLASGFLVWLTATVGSVFAYRHGKWLYHRSRLGRATVYFSIAIVVGIIAIANMPEKIAKAEIDPPLANVPIGVPRGIFPGRVAWVHDSSATDWDGYASAEHWYQPQCTDQVVVEQMLADVILAVAGGETLPESWDAIFRYYNQDKEKGDVGYLTGEKIAIKCNFVTCNITVGNVDETTFEKESMLNNVDTSPQMILSLLRQLVYDAGVDPCDISIGDPTCLTPNYLYDMIYAEFPEVRHISVLGGSGRTAADYSEVPFYWSTINADHTTQDYLPISFAEAEYFINFSTLKGHSAGITLAGKNHYGSLIRMPMGWRSDLPYPGNGYYDMHNNLPNPNHTPGMEQYRPIVDLLGHEELGGKTILYLMDGLFGGYYWDSQPFKWQMEPFNGDWPSSIFASLDPVAIDSVGYDFIRTEWPDVVAFGGCNRDRYPLGLEGGAEDYLHEAALADDPCSGTFYDPERDGIAMTSLGTHEHWNNSTDKQYSQNLSLGYGIELYGVQSSPPIVGDLNRDGRVDEKDLKLLAESWLRQVSQDLWAYWKMDDDPNSTIALDTTENAYDGKLQGDPQWTAGKYGAALSFDGKGDYVDVNDITQTIAGRNFTLAAWVNTTSTINRQFFFSFDTSTGDDRLMLGFPPGDPNLHVNDYNTSSDTTASFSNGQWYHVACVLDDTNGIIKVYVDANEVYTDSAPNSIAADDLFTIGQEYDPCIAPDPNLIPSDFFNGKIDNVTIYDRILTLEEIQQQQFYHTTGDINNDGIVNFLDFAILAENWRK